MVDLKAHYIEDYDEDFVNYLLGVCKGKHNYDKRQTLKDRQVKRDIDRVLKSNR